MLDSRIGLVYIACPYSHPEYVKRIIRFVEVTRISALLCVAGIPVFSPITHSHPMAEFGMPTDWNFWKKYNLIFLDMATMMVVYQLDGWQISVGVSEEREIVEEQEKPILFHSPKDTLQSLIDRIGEEVL